MAFVCGCCYSNCNINVILNFHELGSSIFHKLLQLESCQY
jgi:hypothetical protein